MWIYLGFTSLWILLELNFVSPKKVISSSGGGSSRSNGLNAKVGNGLKSFQYLELQIIKNRSI